VPHIYKRILSRLWREDSGQDLVEYALMAGFVAVAGGAAFPPIARSVSSIFSKAMSVLGRFS
jgi:Flp pilus assembly pilin Flp